MPKDFILSIKINSAEFEKDSFTPEDCAVLCGELEKHGFDFVELSGGTHQASGWTHKRESTRKRGAFFIEFAEQIIPELRKTKAYITGGFRTGPAMVEALKTIHGIGLGRPITHEFDLPQKLIDGRVKSSIDVLFEEDDFGMSSMAADMQMRLVGKNKEPVDLSREDYKQAFEVSFENWRQSMSDNKDGSKFGGVDLLGVELQPYGSGHGAGVAGA